MSRLTKRHGKHAVQIGAETRRHDEAWLKLAHYEDLEEQGRLIELPMPLGKPYYEINANYTISKFPLRPASAGRIIQNELFGRTVFATKEEAEAKLKETRGE